MYDDKGRWIEEDDDYMHTDMHRCPKGHFLKRDPELVQVLTQGEPPYDTTFLPYNSPVDAKDIVEFIWVCKCGEKHAE